MCIEEEEQQQQKAEEEEEAEEETKEEGKKNGGRPKIPIHVYTCIRTNPWTLTSPKKNNAILSLSLSLVRSLSEDLRPGGRCRAAAGRVSTQSRRHALLGSDTR